MYKAPLLYQPQLTAWKDRFGFQGYKTDVAITSCLLMPLVCLTYTYLIYSSQDSTPISQMRKLRLSEAKQRTGWWGPCLAPEAHPPIQVNVPVSSGASAGAQERAGFRFGSVNCQQQPPPPTAAAGSYGYHVSASHLS